METAADLAIAVAIASSYFSIPIPRDLAVVGVCGGVIRMRRELGGMGVVVLALCS